jgi:hypothetical protein
LHEYVNDQPDDEIEQQLFVHVKPPPRKSGITDMEKERPSRIWTVSIVTGHRTERLVGASWETSMAALDCATHVIGILLETW